MRFWALPCYHRSSDRLPVADQQVMASTICLALVMIALGYLHNLLLLCLVSTIGGVAWIMLVSTFNVAAQEASPL